MRLVAPHLPVDEEARQFAAMEAADTEGVVAIDGALDLLGSLPEDGWAIVTSGTRLVATARLVRLGLPVPRSMVCGEDVVNGKPDPEPYLLGARLLDVPPEECVVVEDSPAGLAAASAAGMRTVAIAFTYPEQELANATAVAPRLRDIRVEGVGTGRLRILGADPG
jgi:mannitol-1-/sugar-/sorbitol-6-phosphatase